jgi:uncharacterized protein YrrD
MQLKQGAKVVAHNGSRIGRLARVVLEPESKEVIGIVARKSLGRSHEKVVQVSLIQSADSEQIRLRGEVHDPEELPPFEEVEYVLADEGALPHGSASIDLMSPAHTFPAVGGDRRAYRIRKTENIPPDTVPLKAGARVLDERGGPVGSVEQVLTSHPEDRATHLVVAQGLIRKERKLVPMAWVDEVDRETVRLAVGEGQIDRLRPYDAEPVAENEAK